MGSIRHRLICSAIGAILAALAVSPAANAERIGKVSQPLVGEPVSVKQQRRLGLVSVDADGGSCSGTLINQYWVLTADHCVTVDGMQGTAALGFDKITISATWSDKSAQPTRFVRFWGSNRTDAALLFLGRTDLGHVDRKLIYHDAVDETMLLTSFGQGLCALASDGPPPTRAQSDCGYRTARFTPSRVTPSAIDYKANAEGQITMGGDSGGPAFVTDGAGALIAIAGVTSACEARSRVAGKEDDPGWSWVTDVGECEFAPLIGIRDAIHSAMAEAPPPPMADTRAPVDRDILVSPARGPVETRRPGRFKDIIVAGGAASSPPPPPPPPPAPQQPAEATATAIDDVDVYNGPGRRDDTVIGMLERGDSGAVIDQRGGWVKLRTDRVRAGEGWVAEDHVRIAP